MERQIIGYQIFDKIQNVQVGGNYKPEQKRRARTRADKLDMEYGAYRYFVRPIFNDAN